MIDLEMITNTVNTAIIGGLTCGVMVGAVFAFIKKIG